MAETGYPACNRAALRVCAVVLALAVLVWPYAAESTMVGSVAGRVTDISGQPLEDARVFVEGENLGTLTDDDGNYFLLQIPPGTYAITVYKPGFRSIRRSEVRVFADRTIRIDYALPLAELEIEPQTIPAVPPLIKPDMTSTRHFILPDLYRILPVQTLADAVRHEAGIDVVDGGEFIVRGGTPNEVGFTVDRVVLANPLENRSYTSVNIALVDQIQVLTGAYPAASGNHFSVVNYISRDPSRMPWIVLDGRLTPPQQRKHFGVPAYADDQYDRLLYLNSGTPTNGRLFNVTAYSPDGTPSVWTDAVDSDLPVYRVQPDADEPERDPVFIGWNAVVTEVNSGARSLGDSLIQQHRGDWTVDALRSVWDHRHRPWPYTEHGDYYLDAAVSTPTYILPKSNLLIGYKHQQFVFPVPAVVQNPKTRTLEALLRSSAIPRVSVEAYGRFELLESLIDGAGTHGFPGSGTAKLQRYHGLTGLMEHPPFSPVGVLRSVQGALDDHGGVAGANKYNLWSNTPYEEMSWGGGARMRHAVTGRFAYTLGYDYLEGRVEAEPLSRRGSNDNPYHTDAHFDLILLPNDRVVFLDESPWGYAAGAYSGLDVPGGYYLEGGGFVTDFSRWRSDRGYGSLHAQITPHHGITAGADYSRAILNRDTRIADRLTGANAAFIRYDAEPWELAVFVQDRLTYDELTANIGVRIEAFNAGDRILFPEDRFPDAYARGGFASIMGISAETFRADGAAIPRNERELLDYLTVPLSRDPGWLYASEVLEAVPQEESATYWRVSPRFGVSQPVDENTRAYFSYGRLHVAPEAAFRHGYHESGQRLGNPDGAVLGTGNPNLRPVRRTLYEIGAERVFSGNQVLQVRGYSGIDDMLPERITYAGHAASAMSGGPSSEQVVYSTYDDSRFRTYRGFEAELQRCEGASIAWSISADLREVTEGVRGGRVVYEHPAAAGESSSLAATTTDLIPAVRGHVHLRTPADWGNVTGNWGITAMQTYRRGSRLLYYRAGHESDPVSFRWADIWRTDVRAEKSFRIGNGSFSLYGDVRNVFNRKTFNLGAVDHVRYFEDILMEGGDTPIHRIGEFGYQINGEDARAIVERRLVREDDWLLYLFPRSYQIGVRVNF